QDSRAGCRGSARGYRALLDFPSGHRVHCTTPSYSTAMKSNTRFFTAAFAPAVILLSLVTAPGAAAAPKVRLTHELLWMMKRVGAPVVSPDGKWVVFPVLEPSYEPDKEASDLWLVPADGSAPARRITNTRTPESGVAWSPDSHSIAFS